MSGLFGSTILEVLIGLFLVYFVLATICAHINELIAILLKWRARDLESGLQNLLCDPELADKVLNHQLIKALGNTNSETALVRFFNALSRGWSRLISKLPFFPFKEKDNASGWPGYIPSRTFARALFDVLTPENDPTKKTVNVATIRDEVARMIVSGDPAKKAFGIAILNLTDTLGTMRHEATTLSDEDIKKIQESIKRILDFTNEAVSQNQDFRNRIDNALGLEEIRGIITELPLESNARKTALSFLGNIQLRLDTALKTAQDELETALTNVQTWFDDAMDRVSGVYKRRTQIWVLFISLLIAVTLGVATFRLINRLANDPAKRAALVQTANTVLNAASTPTPTTNGLTPTTTPSAPVTTTGSITATSTLSQTTQAVDNLTADLARFDELGLPVGYADAYSCSSDPNNSWWCRQWWQWLINRLLGVLVTAFAVSLGAPFWFDVLGKVSNIRGAGQPPPKAEDETKADKKP